MPEPASYIKIADDLREQIRDGRLPAGARLPSRALIAADYGVGANVAIAAIRHLTAEGLVVTRAGSGAYVRERRAPRRMVRSWHPHRYGGSLYIAELGAAGSRGTRESESATENAPHHIANRLRIKPGARVMRTEYRFLIEDEPAMLSTSWEPLAITGGTPVVLPEAGPLGGQGIVERMASIDVIVTRAQETVTPRPASKDEADALALTGPATVASIERTYFAGDVPIEASDIVVPAERYQLVYEFSVNQRDT